jgi:hypothetical protein
MEEVPAALTWATYDPTTQWQDAENTGLGEIDRPGDYTLIARDANPVDSYSIAANVALSGLGYLYENAQGQILTLTRLTEPNISPLTVTPI